jgi:WhiB family redox-sensing transcriptional regulator
MPEPLCAGVKPGLFQSDEPEYNPERAKAICERCPLRDACLETAMKAERSLPAQHRAGIWGGKTAMERASLDRRVRRQQYNRPRRPNEPNHSQMRRKRNDAVGTTKDSPTPR